MFNLTHNTFDTGHGKYYARFINDEKISSFYIQNRYHSMYNGEGGSVMEEFAYYQAISE